MILLDTNIYIYLANQTLASTIIRDDIGYATVTRIEALGFHNLSVGEEHQLAQLFASSEQYQLTEDVIARAITIRQMQRIGLGDAIIAATALEAGCDLWTANIEDFSHIEGLTVINPLAKTS